MIDIIDLRFYKKNILPARVKKIINRKINVPPQIEATVAKIIRHVQKNGNQALLRYTARFDGVALGSHQLRVKRADLKHAWDKIDPFLKKSLRAAQRNIFQFHQRQKQSGLTVKQKNGIKLRQRIMPLASVGVYVPGGKAAYPSTILMTVTPAQVAGVKRIVVATPPKMFFENDSIAATLHLLGLNEVYLMGGAQAIAALAFGTETIRRVDKIVGPGNIFVELAKLQVFGQVDIDMTAGPTEILVLCDQSANPRFIAADLLSQLEHGTGFESAICLTTSPLLAKQIKNEIMHQVISSNNQYMLKRGLKRFGTILLVKSLPHAVDLANAIAPEHLEIMTRQNEKVLKKIENTGSIFLGDYAAEAVGDYFAGPNHVLPTGGSARFFSPLGTYDFIKRSSVIHYSKQALNKSGKMIAKLAESEGLPLHGKAIKIRMS